jgi:hypothetical protein
MGYKKFLISILIVTLLLNLNGCSDTSKISAMSPIQKQVEFINKNMTVFQNSVDIFSSNADLLSITPEKSYVSERNGHKIEKVNELYFTSKKIYEKKKYDEIHDQIIPIFSDCKLAVIDKVDDFIQFTYATTLGKGVGWIYSKNGVEPSKKDFYITEITKINDNWYACIWS